MPTDLGTKSVGTAKIRVGEVVRMRAASGQASVASPIPVVQPYQPSVNNVGAGAGAPNGPVVTGSPLDDWYNGESEFQRTESTGVVAPQTSGGSVPDAPLSAVSPSQAPTGLAKVINWEGTPGADGLSSDEKMRLHGLLASVVGRLNVLGVGLGVRVFGRIPAEPEQADMELLNKAWALQLNEMFADKEIKPAILIAAASVGLGVGMYVNGEDKPKPPPKVSQ